uniref:Capsid protein n=1 Tax=Geladintestivirus 4 TaxID=3233136 RepID=A0AAU8MIH6_9CAUD
MTTAEMHQMFRNYAQQMGMQNVRAILPSQIDLLLNNSISDTVNQVIAQNIGTTSDRVITDNSKLNQVNALKSLYRVWKGKVTLPAPKTNYIASYILPLTNFRLATEDKSDVKKGNAVYADDATGDGKPASIEYFFLVDLSIDYTKNVAGGSFTTNIFPIRLVDDQYLADVVNDFVMAPNLRSPVATIHDNNIELYIDKPDANTKTTPNSYKFGDGLSVNEVRLSYIGKPGTVHFNEDIGGEDVDCELPESMHVDIVKHAVDLYRTALNGGLAAAQGAQQQQQRENVRNNARDEGYEQPSR